MVDELNEVFGRNGDVDLSKLKTVLTDWGLFWDPITNVFLVAGKVEVPEGEPVFEVIKVENPVSVRDGGFLSVDGEDFYSAQGAAEPEKPQQSMALLFDFPYSEELMRSIPVVDVSGNGVKKAYENLDLRRSSDETKGSEYLCVGRVDSYEKLSIAAIDLESKRFQTVSRSVYSVDELLLPEKENVLSNDFDCKGRIPV